MRELKDGLRSHVRLDWNNQVHKTFRGSDALVRYQTEIAALKTLEARGCPNVPRLLQENPDELCFVSTSCGESAPSITSKKVAQLFADLEINYGVRHLDPERRNITYDSHRGGFCIIDFELCEILPEPQTQDPSRIPLDS